MLPFFRGLTRPLRAFSSLRSTIQPNPPPRNALPSNFFSSRNARTYSSKGPHRSSKPPQSSFPTDYTAINTKVLYAFMGLNGAIFAYASFSRKQAEQSGDIKPFIDFMKNFTLNLNSVLQEGRWWTILTSCFTHTAPFHLLGNMLSIYYIGGILCQTPGFAPGRLVTLIIGSGLSGSIGYLYIRAQATRGTYGPDMARGLGFSGCVMGVGAVAAILYPRTQMAIYGIIPVPLWLLMGGYALYDGYYLNTANTGVAHAGHLGGLAFGVLYYVARLRGFR